MRPSPRRPLALLATLMFALLLVLLADIDAVASAEPLPTDGGAVLVPVSPASLTRPYSRSSLRLSSRLLDGDGHPIRGARIDVLQRVLGSSRMVVVGSAVTVEDGSFTALVPAGPSRVIDLAYRPDGAGGYLAQTLILEHVSAGLRLHISPLRTTPTGTVLLDGRVLGVVPAHGVVVEVLVYYLGGWQPIRTPRTSPSGRFRVRYRFHQARGEFPFRLRVRDGQAGFPYGGGWSAWVGVVA